MSVVMDSFDFVLGFIRIPANFMLIVAIIFSKESQLKAYTIILLNSAITDLVEVCVELMAMTRMMAEFPYLVYIFEGFCAHIGTYVCQISMQIELHLMFHSILLIAVAFWYRNCVLSGNDPSFIKTQIVILSALIPTIISTSIFDWSDDSEQILPHFYPKINLNEVVHASCNFKNTRMKIIVIWTSVAPTVAYCAIFYYRQKVNRKMREQVNTMSNRTRRMHSSLITALFYHAVIPSVSSLGMIGFIAQNFGFQYALIERAAFMFCTIPPAINPLLTLYFVHPYRRFILRIVIRGPHNRGTMISSVGHSDRTTSNVSRS